MADGGYHGPVVVFACDLSDSFGWQTAKNLCADVPPERVRMFERGEGWTRETPGTGDELQTLRDEGLPMIAAIAGDLVTPPVTPNDRPIPAGAFAVVLITDGGQWSKSVLWDDDEEQ